MEIPTGTTDLQITPNATLDGQRVPKDWIPREFNGMRYYDIPLSTGR